MTDYDKCIIFYHLKPIYHTAMFCHLSGRARVMLGDSTLTTAHWFPFFCLFLIGVGQMLSTDRCIHLHHRFTSVLQLQTGESPKLSKKKKKKKSGQTRIHRNIPAPTDRWHTRTQKLPGGEFWVLLTSLRPQVWVQLILGGVRWIWGASGSMNRTRRGARWGSPELSNARTWGGWVRCGMTSPSSPTIRLGGSTCWSHVTDTEPGTDTSLVCEDASPH